VRLEFTDEKSNKFWEAASFDSGKVRLMWGRIGTVGQSMDKMFDNIIEANANIEKVAEDKVSRGYRWIAGGTVQLSKMPRNIRTNDFNVASTGVSLGQAAAVINVAKSTDPDRDAIVLENGVTLSRSNIIETLNAALRGTGRSADAAIEAIRDLAGAVKQIDQRPSRQEARSKTKTPNSILDLGDDDEPSRKIRLK
jgi:predicted DNA-binding WGR domain protein